MQSVSMTATLGLAAVVGTIAIIIIGTSRDEILASGKEQATIPHQCKTCAISTSIHQVVREKAVKSAQQGNRSADAQLSLDKKYKSVQAMVVEESGAKPLRTKPLQPPAKKALQLLVENPPQPVEKPQSRRLRRADDPFLQSFN